MFGVVSIRFPNLGLVFKDLPVSINIFGIEVAIYGLLIAIGAMLGMLLAFREAKRTGQNVDHYVDLALFGIFFAIIGTRLFYVIFEWDYYSKHLGEIFNLRNGGLAIYGGIIGAVIATAIYCKVKKLSFLKVADIAAPGLLIGQAIGRYGNFFNAEVYGFETALPWGMSINGANPVHPLFLYESAWNILGLLIILLLRDKKKAHGQVFLSYILWYSFGRFFLEGMRQPEYVLKLTENAGVSQILAGVLVVVSAVLIILLGEKRKIVPVDGVIFDLDGTMWDATENLVQPWNEVFSEYEVGRQVTHEDMMSVMGLTLSEIGEVFMPEVDEELREEIVHKASERETVCLMELGGKLYPELKETLSQLKKKYNLYIVSNCQEDYLECYFTVHDTRDYFTDCEFSGRTGLPKDENIKMLVERNNLKNPIYVGDTKKDMDAAKKAGVHFIHATYGFGEIEDKFTIKLEEIKLLPEFIPFFE